MIHLGLIGYPLGHSFSPKLHTSALQACGLEGYYSLFPIAPDDNQLLKDLLSRIRSGEIQGLNVTIPHKQNVIQYLDDLTPTAKSIGAVNTIYSRDAKLIGDNTDASGFLLDLKRFLTTRLSRRMVSGETPRHRVFSALVLGAGGSARAVVYALINDGWEVTIAARRIEQGQQLANSFANYKLRIPVCSLSDIESNPTNLQSLISNISLLINTTPVGMAPNMDQSPWPENLPFPAHAAIYDLVYNPRETRLVKDACSQGLSATTGLGMLVEQAALSFELWTGHKPPREAMLAAINQTTY